MKPHGSVGSAYEIPSRQDDSRHKASQENHCNNESTWPPWPVCAKPELSFLGWQTPRNKYHGILCERCPGELNIKLMCTLIVLIHFWSHKIRKMKHNIEVLFVTCVIYNLKLTLIKWEAEKDSNFLSIAGSTNQLS